MDHRSAKGFTFIFRIIYLTGLCFTFNNNQVTTIIRSQKSWKFKNWLLHVGLMGLQHTIAPGEERETIMVTWKACLIEKWLAQEVISG